LDNGHHAEDATTEDQTPNHATSAAGLNFFQHSELETDGYPSSAHGFPTQGISFLQESELGTSQPHEDYTSADRVSEIEDLSRSPQLPPIQTLTDAEGPPKVNLGIGTFAGAGTGEAGNAAAEKMLSDPPSSQSWANTESKTDWAEEASPTTETAPILPEKKKEEEWTTQASRHSRHQSQQQRGRGGASGGQRGRGDNWRGNEGRGGSRGGYRGGRGGDRGDRGTSNGERRGSWRGGDRGRGRGSNSLPPTAV
jgi:hypothetical protein